MSGCLGDVAAALADGELDHAARERAQRHLAHCAGCRAEVEAHRRLKARLRATPALQPSDALTARLRALQAPDDSSPVRPLPPVAGRPVPVRPVLLRPASVRPAARPTGAAGRARRAAGLRRRAVAGSAVAALGVVAALALGSPPQRPGSTPVDPTTEAFVTEFVSTANDGAGGVVSRASLTGASTAGSARSAR